MNLFRALLHDEHGFIISAELVVISTLLVVGLVTGLQYIQASVVGEMQDVGAAIGSLNQSYSYAGQHGCCDWGHGYSSWTRGSCFADTTDEPREHVDFAWLDNNVPCQNVVLSDPQTPQTPDEKSSDAACDKPCNEPCGNPCGEPCGNACGNACGNHCDHSCGDKCGDTCRRPCGNSCGDACRSHCGHSCGSPCGSSCGSPCDHPCDDPCGNRCDDPCSSAGRPARIYGSSKSGCGSRTERYATLDCGPLPALPPLRPCPVNDNPCPSCSVDDVVSPECGPQMYPRLSLNCRPCSPTDLQIVW